MKANLLRLGALLLVASLNLPLVAAPLGTAFTYQGRLNAAGVPANGLYDLRFTLYDAQNGDNVVGAAITSVGTGVTNGLFTVGLDFGNVFNGNSLWLEIAARTNGASTFTPLAPRQALTPTPQATYATSAGSAQTAATAGTATSLTSPLAGDKLGGLYPNVVNFNNPTNVFSGTFYGENHGNTYGNFFGYSFGDGNGLYNLNAGNLAAGTVADARLSANVALLSTNQLFGGSNRFAGVLIATNLLNQVAGAFTGNGGGLLNLNASQLTTGVVPLAQLPAELLTNNASSVSIGGTNVVAALTVPPKLPGAAMASLSTGPNSYPRGLAIAGRYAYVAVAGSNVLRVVDVSTPSAPAFVGLVGTDASPTAVAAAGRYAYVVCSTANTLQVFDISNPSAPVRAGSAGTGSSPAAVAVAGRYAYVVNFLGNTLQVFDVSNPSSPSQVGVVATGSNPSSLVTVGRYGYALSASGLQIFELSNPAAPTLVGSAGPDLSAGVVAVVGRYAYATRYYGGTLNIFDVSNPSAPVGVGSVAMQGNPQGIVAAGRYAYVADDYSSLLRLFDVSNPSAPVSLGSVGTGAFADSITVEGRYAYLTARSGGLVQVFDLGGAYVQQLETGTLETGTLQARDAVTVGNNLDVRGALSVSAGARISGGLSVDNGTISATNFNGSGLNLSGLNAANLASGTLADARLSANVALLNASQTFSGANTFSGSLSFSSTVQHYASTYLNDRDLQLRGDSLHGLGFYGGSKTFAGLDVNGPGLYGNSGGVLGSKSGTSTNAALAWKGGNVAIDPTESNTGSLQPGLTFGSINGNGSGEGISSKRTSGTGQFGLDFYTGSTLRMTVANNGNVGIGTNNPQQKLHVIGSIYATGTITPNSDRTLKTDFAPVDTTAVLERVAALPIQQWRFQAEPAGVKHVGPMAQDFRTAFGLGEIPTAIATVDADGVALAAIQGLNQKLEAKNAGLEKQLRAREAQLEALTRRLEALEQQLAK